MHFQIIGWFIIVFMTKQYNMNSEEMADLLLVGTIGVFLFLTFIAFVLNEGRPILVDPWLKCCKRTPEKCPANEYENEWRNEEKALFINLTKVIYNAMDGVVSFYQNGLVKCIENNPTKTLSMNLSFQLFWSVNMKSCHGVY